MHHMLARTYTAHKYLHTRTHIHKHMHKHMHPHATYTHIFSIIVIHTPITHSVD